VVTCYKQLTSIQPSTYAVQIMKLATQIKERRRFRLIITINAKNLM